MLFPVATQSILILVTSGTLQKKLDFSIQELKQQLNENRSCWPLTRL